MLRGVAAGMSDLADDPVPRQHDGDSPISLSPSVRCFALLRVASICVLPPLLDRLLQVRRRLRVIDLLYYVFAAFAVPSPGPVPKVVQVLARILAVVCTIWPTVAVGLSIIRALP